MSLFLFGAKKRFYNGWCLVFKENAKIYNGMFNSLKKMSEGKTKNTDKIVKELCSRTEYNVKNIDTKQLCEITQQKLCAQNKKTDKWMKLLMKAIDYAAIYCESEKRLVLDESNTNDYTEWDMNEICVGDTVEVLNPAWYQDGKLIEQGHCSIVEENE